MDGYVQKKLSRCMKRGKQGAMINQREKDGEREKEKEG